MRLPSWVLWSRAARVRRDGWRGERGDGTAERRHHTHANLQLAGAIAALARGSTGGEAGGGSAAARRVIDRCSLVAIPNRECGFGDVFLGQEARLT